LLWYQEVLPVIYRVALQVQIGTTMIVTTVVGVGIVAEAIGVAAEAGIVVVIVGVGIVAAETAEAGR